MESELIGPRVSVDRNGTADRGGGQLVIKQGKLFVRTRSLERLLGPSIAIDHIQLVDLARMRATVNFIDGQIWNVQSEQGEDLTAFFRQVEFVAGRSGLLRDPPRISELVRAAATPSRTRTALLTALALLAYVPLRWLGGVVATAGLVIAVLGVIALMLGAIVFVRREKDGLASARFQAQDSTPWLAAAIAAIVAGSLGYSDATARSLRAAQEVREQADATQRAQAAAAEEKQDAQNRRARADGLAAEMLEAIQSERFRDAKALYARVEVLAPDHPVTKQVSAQLERALAELDERERVAGVARGISQARVVSKDRLACDTAKRVADVHDLLRRVQPSDADYDAARRALDSLEHCRKRVRAHFAQSAEDGRRSKRMMAATQIEAAARRLGHPVNVRLSGRNSDVLRIEARDLDATVAERILASSERMDATFEAARTEEGFTRIELRGDKFSQDVKLHPLPPEALITPVLEKFGLASSLALQASAE